MFARAFASSGRQDDEGPSHRTFGTVIAERDLVDGGVTTWTQELGKDQQGASGFPSGPRVNPGFGRSP
jgi:hypothetical protein